MNEISSKLQHLNINLNKVYIKISLLVKVAKAIGLFVSHLNFTNFEISLVFSNGCS